jgi:outer membrane protein assembly factor BamB
VSVFAWPVQRGTLSNNDLSYDTLQLPLILRWRSQELSGVIWGQPVAEAGQVVVSNLNGSHLYGFDAGRGTLRWQIDGPDYQSYLGIFAEDSSPALSQGRLFVIRDEKLFAYSPPKVIPDWTSAVRRPTFRYDDHPFEAVPPSPVPIEGVGLLFADYNNLFLLDPSNGAVLGRHSTIGNIVSTPAVDIQNETPVLYLYSRSSMADHLEDQSDDVTVSAVTLPNLQTVWARNVADGSRQPLVLDDDHIYAITGAGLLALSRSDGHPVWRVSAVNIAPPDSRGDRDSDEFSAPAVASDAAHNLVFTHQYQTGWQGGHYTFADQLVCISSSDGHVRWRKPLTRHMGEGGSPAIAGDRVVVSTMSSIAIFRLSDGTLLWESKALPVKLSSAPTIAHGLVFVLANLADREGSVLLAFGPR